MLTSFVHLSTLAQSSPEHLTVPCLGGSCAHVSIYHADWCFLLLSLGCACYQSCRYCMVSCPGWEHSCSIADHNPTWGVLTSGWGLWHNYLMRMAENSDLVMEERSLFYFVRKSQQSSMVALREVSEWEMLSSL